jgi:hypothetical protein
MRSRRLAVPYRSAKHSRFSRTLSRWYRPGDSGTIAIWRLIFAPFAGVSGSPATTADPDVGAISVPSVRTVVVLPAPFGPRKPNTSPCPISKLTSANATLSPNVLPRPLTDTAAASVFRSWLSTAITDPLAQDTDISMIGV